jgi:hypothetical protein
VDPRHDVPRLLIVRPAAAFARVTVRMVERRVATVAADRLNLLAVVGSLLPIPDAAEPRVAYADRAPGLFRSARRGKGGGRADVCVLEYVPNAVEAEA